MRNVIDLSAYTNSMATIDKPGNKARHMKAIRAFCDITAYDDTAKYWLKDYCIEVTTQLPSE